MRKFNLDTNIIEIIEVLCEDASSSVFTSKNIGHVCNGTGEFHEDASCLISFCKTYLEPQPAIAIWASELGGENRFPGAD